MMQNKKRMSGRKIRSLAMAMMTVLAAGIFLASGFSAEAATKAGAKAAAKTPYALHGALQVKDGSLVDCHGKPYRLVGVSTHGLAWYPEYVSKASFKTLRDGWKANVVRLAMYTEEYGGWCNTDKAGREKLEKTIDTGVKAVTSLGMYGIIDWHILSDGNPLTHEKEAAAFFDKMSSRYSRNGNILYEICNEPNGSTTWKDVKEYASQIIPVIRQHDPDAIILIGTPTWSQEIDDPAKDPIEGTNLMYTMHFYAATHGNDLRQRLVQAKKKGTPVFISEFGIGEASGSGRLDYQSAAAWFDILDQYDISYVGWNLSNKDESSAMIRPECSKLSGWKDADLSDSGRYMKKTLREHM